MLIEISEIFWSTGKLSNVEFKRVVRMKFWFSVLISFKLLNGLKIIIMKRFFFDNSQFLCLQLSLYDNGAKCARYNW